MPAKSEKQRRIMGVALSMKRGETPKSYSKEAAEIASSMSEEDLEDFASKSLIKSINNFIHRLGKKLL
jgi:hypothetical protein